MRRDTNPLSCAMEEYFHTHRCDLGRWIFVLCFEHFIMRFNVNPEGFYFRSLRNTAFTTLPVVFVMWKFVLDRPVLFPLYVSGFLWIIFVLEMTMFVTSADW